MSGDGNAKQRRKLLQVTTWAVAVSCAVLLLLDWPIHQDPHFHPHFASESWLGFYGWVAVIGTGVLVATANLLRSLFGRAEDYYDQ